MKETRPKKSAGTTPAPRRRKSTRAQAQAQAPEPLALPGGDLMAALWRPRQGGVADQLLGIVGAAAQMSMGLGRALGAAGAPRKTLGKAGSFLRSAREAAGLTVSEVSAAIDLKDPAMLELAENGKAALPVEVLLRLAAVLARNDPIPFLMQVARNYSPPLWKALEQLGIGQLVLHAGREHEFINIYRSRDAARRLSDEEFEQVLAFTDAAFRMALKLVVDAGRRAGAAEQEPEQQR